jgi:FKBP-type peptidyl-prolyl cis-trans isomerase 2
MKYLIFVLLLLTVGCVSDKAPDEIDYSELVLESGDLVKMDFIGTIGETGEVFDTTYADVANNIEIEKAETFVFTEKYSQISFTIGTGDVLPALEMGLVGMKMGETRKITLNPEEGYGEYVSQKSVSLKRSTVIPRLTIVLISDFRGATGREPELNESIMLNYWNVTVVNISGENMTLSHEPEDDSDINTEYGPAHITLNETHVTTTISPVLDDVVATPYGTGIIKDVNETHFIIDYNHPLAGSTLIFEVKVNDILKAGRPDGEGITWHDYEEGINIAKNEKKPTMLYFNPAGCRACEAMDKLTFQNPEIIGIKNRFIWVDIDADARPELAAEYGVTGYPTLVVLDGDGEILEGLVGYLSPYDLKEIIDFLVPEEKA